MKIWILWMISLQLIDAAIDEEPPLTVREGGIIKRGL